MSASEATEDLLRQYEAKLSNVGPRAVYIQLGVMAAVSAGTLFIFCALRPGNSKVYQPKVKYSEDGKAPPRIEKGFFSWIKPLWSATEETLVDTIGLDAVVYLRFLRMCQRIFVACAIVCCAVLIPINVSYNLREVDASDRNILSILTIQNIGGQWIWAHVAITYVVTAIVFVFVWINYLAVCRLRWTWFRSPEYQNSLNSRSILITQVAKQYQSDKGIASLLQSLAIPYPTSAINVGRRVGVVPELVEQHNESVMQLERVLTNYFNAQKNGKTVKRPMMKVGGEKVDAIEALTARIQRLEARVESARAEIDSRKATNYGFASFEAVPYAHAVGKRLEGKRKHGARFELAPQPIDIIWRNLHLTDGDRGSKKFFGWVLLIVVLVLYTIPLVAVSLLANLTALTTYVQFLDDWSNNSPTSFSAFTGVVPPALAFLLQLVLPMVIRSISRLQGATTKSQLDRIVTARYSAFLFISQFFIFSLLGVFFQLVNQLVIDIGRDRSFAYILRHMSDLPDELQNTWVVQSTYWLTVFPLRGFSACFDLAQAISLVYTWIRTKLFGRTPREIREWTKPPLFDFPVYYSNSMLMVAVGFVYAPLAPLVPLFAACMFAVSLGVYKYQLMYVFVSRVETGGRLWRVVVNRLLVSLVAMQLLMTLTVGLKMGWLRCVAVAPAIVAVIIFKLSLKWKFDNAMSWYIPDEAEIAESMLHTADARKNRLQRRFGHPSMTKDLYTPMLNKDIAHLLPTVYHGRVGETKGTVDGQAVDAAKAGGLTFDLLAERDLEYDRMAYLRQRDEDTMSVSTANMLGPATGTPGGVKVGEGDYFAAKRAEYLHNGPRGASPAPTYDTMDAMELSRMNTRMTHGSTDRLIQSPPQREMHMRQYSGQTTPGSIMGGHGGRGYAYAYPPPASSAPPYSSPPQQFPPTGRRSPGPNYPPQGPPPGAAGGYGSRSSSPARALDNGFGSRSPSPGRAAGVGYGAAPGHRGRESPYGHPPTHHATRPSQSSMTQGGYASPPQGYASPGTRSRAVTPSQSREQLNQQGRDSFDLGAYGADDDERIRHPQEDNSRRNWR